MFTLLFNKSTGGYTETTVPDMVKAKEAAKKYLSKDPSGSVMVLDPSRKEALITTYYIDMNTKAIKDARHEKFIIGHNDAYPHTSASTLTEARIKACTLMHKEGWRSLIIYNVKVNKETKMAPVGATITNGYRYMYSNFVKNKTVSLNPKTGRAQ